MVAVATAISTGATSPDVQAEQPAVVAFVREMLLRQPAEGYAVACEALGDSPVPDIAEVRAPTLIITGTADGVCSPERAEEIAADCRRCNEFFDKLGAPFFSFHDVDIAPAGDTFAESARSLDEMVDVAAGHMERTGTKLLWGTTNAFSHPRFMAGAATNPDPAMFQYAAAQVAHCLQATKRLGGANYVLWGGRYGAVVRGTRRC